MNKRILGSLIGLVIVVIFLICITIPRKTYEEVKEIKADANTVTEAVVATTVEPVKTIKKPHKPNYLRTDIPLTEEEQTLLYKACEINECDYTIALSVMYVETRFQNVVGDDGNSLGYFQIQPRWVQDIMSSYGLTDLMDAKTNFFVGTKLLGNYIGEHGLIDGLTRYNTGHLGRSIYAQKVIEARGMLYGMD